MENQSEFESQTNPQAQAPEISPRKLEANRKNALKSTGPKTVTGKRFSSRNALKHGLLSRDLVIRDGAGKESVEEFQQLLAELIGEHRPQGRTELSLVETVAVCDWRFRRALHAEAAEIASGQSCDVDFVLPPPHITDMILRYQTTIYRQKMQALQLLGELQQRRGKLLQGSAAILREAEEE